jgi:hypothetical protein
MAECLRALVLGACLLVAPLVHALQAGQALPPLQVEKLGEIVVNGEDSSFRPWQSAALPDRLHIVQYLAARLSARKLSKPFTDRLEKSGIPYARYHISTVVNLDDALFGTRGMVLSELEKNKRKYALSTIVADETGRGRELWGLQESSSAVIILDTTGSVLYVHEGAMLEEDIQRALAVVRGDAAIAGAR